MKGTSFYASLFKLNCVDANQKSGISAKTAASHSVSLELKTKDSQQ